MNSSNNNSKFKNLDELKAKLASKNGGASAPSGFGFGSSGGFGGGFGAKIPARRQQEQIIIEEEEEVGPGKLFDYDMNQVDASLLPPKDIAKPIMVGVIVVISLVFGGFIGWCWQNVLAERNNVNERIEVAKKVYDIVNPKVDNFQSFTQIFKQRSESLGAGVLAYNESFFNNVIVPYKERNFVLDISNDLPANVISMASNAANNPLSDLRNYAAGTTLLAEILDSHISLTQRDAEEIKQLLGTSSATDRNIVYALKIDRAKALEILEIGSDRFLEALRSDSVYLVKNAITDDREADKAFREMIDSGKISAEQAQERTYKSDPKKKTKGVESTLDPNLTVPNRLMYVIADHAGKTETVFADEIILLDRNKLFTSSANALERYRSRMIQILQLLGEIEKTTDGLISRLHVISTEDPL